MDMSREQKFLEAEKFGRETTEEARRWLESELTEDDLTFLRRRLRELRAHASKTENERRPRA
jgi:hypothetical protein